MKLVLTGKIGIGKTSICKRILEKTRSFICCGILTQRVQKQGKTSRFIVKDISNCRTKVFAYRKLENLEKIPKGITFCDYIFSESGIEFAKEAIKKTGDLLIIDEIGYLEIDNQGITNAISAFQSKNNKHSILVIRYELKETLSALINCPFEVIEVNKKNRDNLPEIIFKKMFKTSKRKP